ncbi:MAG TPA: EutN/CcmL family microcompartment protein [Thermoanaerobaculia bacterium]|nr:EutN/CcmL family microcompartment protein [Thermoanaerobaculia bacterium]
MILGRVIGEIHGTIKHRFYETRRMLIVEKTSPDGAPSGDYLIAVDSVGAGADEWVLVNDEGNGARQIFDAKDAPVRSVVVGIVDRVETGDGA